MPGFITTAGLAGMSRITIHCLRRNNRCILHKHPDQKAQDANSFGIKIVVKFFRRFFIGCSGILE
jgi:hypothetical protein